METQKTVTYNIVDFSQSPGPRYCNQGDDSGEMFYHDVLNKIFADAYSSGSKLCVNLDGADGYASSFLDEAFGNLVYDFTAAVVNDRLHIISNDETIWDDMIKNETIPEWERRRIEGKAPRKTEKHSSWYRLIDGKLKDDFWE